MEKIDFVMLWVDGQDEVWLKKKNYWKMKYGMEQDNNERYRSWENLQYFFRGVEKFAPWVNNVFLITDMQVPQWLEVNHPNIRLIDHQDFIPDEYLPTFNSNTIELNLHRIEELSENFVLFNDDIFFLSETSPKDFFYKGQPRDSAGLNVIFSKSGYPLGNTIFNNVALINDNFSMRETVFSNLKGWISPHYGTQSIKTILLLPWPYFTGFFDHHICVSYNKSNFEELWSKYYSELHSTSLSKFRTKDNLSHWLVRYWQLASNKFVPRKKKYGYTFNLSDKDSIVSCSNHIINQKSKIICVNDTESLVCFDDAKTKVNESLDNILKEKSNYEK